MEIQYVIINFIILVAIIVLAGRKTIKRIFGDRLEKINKALDEAEEIEKLEMGDVKAKTKEALGQIKSKILSIRFSQSFYVGF